MCSYITDDVTIGACILSVTQSDQCPWYAVCTTQWADWMNRWLHVYWPCEGVARHQTLCCIAKFGSRIIITLPTCKLRIASSGWVIDTRLCVLSSLNSKNSRAAQSRLLANTQQLIKYNGSSPFSHQPTTLLSIHIKEGAMYIRVTLSCGHLFILWQFHLGISCAVFVLICTVVVLYCFVMCGCVCVCVCVFFLI